MGTVLRIHHSHQMTHFSYNSAETTNKESHHWPQSEWIQPSVWWNLHLQYTAHSCNISKYCAVLKCLFTLGTSADSQGTVILALHIIHGCIEQPQSLWRVHNTHHLVTLCLGLPGWASTRKVKPIWILLKQETVSGSGISWAICKSAPRSRQITTPVPHHSVLYRPGALPAAQPTASKHWRQYYIITYWLICINTEILGWLGWPKWKRAAPLYLKLL